jgi:hypothetical protein
MPIETGAGNTHAPDPEPLERLDVIGTLAGLGRIRWTLRRPAGSSPHHRAHDRAGRQHAGALALIALLLAAPASGQVSPGPGVQVLQSQVLADDLFNLYSAETEGQHGSGRGKIWLGGWSAPQDMPRDRIFLGILSADRSLSELIQVLQLPDALVNDPAVTPVPGDGDLRMYFTRLSLEDVDHATERNVVWTARSSDGGITWRDRREAIGQLNGVNACGAWSPSVLVEDGLLCVYFHGNSPCLGVYRTCFLPDGVSVARPTEQLSLPFGLANVDVARSAGRYVMVGDMLGLTTFLEIRGVESDDGESWRPLSGTADGLLVQADEGVVFTPHIGDVWNDTLTLLFTTRSSFDTVTENNVLHQWTVRPEGTE